MNVRRVLLFALLTAFLVSFASNVTGESAQSTPFNVLFPDGSNLGFQNEDNYVLLTVTNGTVNSSAGRITLYNGGGIFRFTANESCIFTVSHNATVCNVWGDQDNDLRGVASGSTINVVTNNAVAVQWSFAEQPFLPLGFLLGIIGLTGTVASPMYFIHLWKKRQYRKAFIDSLIIFAICISLLLAWLW